MNIQKLAEEIYQRTGCDDVVAYQTAESLIKEGWTQVDRDAKLPNKPNPITPAEHNAQVDMLNDGWVKEIKDSTEGPKEKKLGDVLVGTAESIRREYK